MKTLFIGNIEALSYELAGNLSGFDPVTVTKDILPEDKFDLVIINDNHVPSYELRDLKEKYNSVPVFYLISYDIRQAVIDNKADVCRNLEITPILPKLSVKQQTDLIIAYLKGDYNRDRDKKVATFISTHAQSGLTQAILSTAAKIAEISNYSTVVCSLTSSNPASLYLQAYGTTLNDLYTSIDNNRSVLKSSDLKNLLHLDSKGFYFLPGNQDYTKRNHYHIDDIEYLIDMLCEEFDIVLIDAGHDPDTNLTIQALLKADIKFVNTTQQPIGSLLWRKMNEDIFGRYLNISPDEFLMIVNKYSNDIPRREIKTLETEMGVTEIARIPDCGDEGILCELNRSLLYDVKNNAYRKALHEAYFKLSKMILERFNLWEEPTSGKEEKRAWPWRKNA